MSSINCRRVLLKLSGESLMGSRQSGHDLATVKRISEDIKLVADSGVQVCVVVGGGNLCRGADMAELGIERSAADYMGMLATIMNAIALQNVIEPLGLTTRILSAMPVSSICEPYIRRRAERHLDKGRVVIFAAGTGNPFFTTDSAAVLRAIEMNCDILLKGTQVDGVYDSDPRQNPDAKKYNSINYDEVLSHNLQIMDMAAIALAKENHLPIKVFSIAEAGNFYDVLADQGKFTKIQGKKE